MIQMHRRTKAQWLAEIGDFYWHFDEQNQRSLYFICPSKTNPKGSDLCVITIAHENNNGASWSWNGDEDNPTILPSVLFSMVKTLEPETKEEIWHGWIKQGKLVDV